MEVDTLIIGYVPLEDAAGKKPAAVRSDKYFRDLLARFDIGTIHYADQSDWKEKADQINPLIIISLGGSWYAEEVRRYKEDALLYAVDDLGSVFRRKAEAEEKKQKHIRVFTEVADFVKRFRSGEENPDMVRKFAAMSYDDLYKMIIQAIIGKDRELSKRAWNLLMDDNGQSKFVWMRAQLIVEVWQNCDGKGKEEMLCMAMNQHIDEEMARKIDDFTDENGQKYHQYMFRDPFGEDLDYIRRIPFGVKGQDKYAYE